LLDTLRIKVSRIAMSSDTGFSMKVRSPTGTGAGRLFALEGQVPVVLSVDPLATRCWAYSMITRSTIQSRSTSSYQSSGCEVSSRSWAVPI
jgi:hypothetical protein